MSNPLVISHGRSSPKLTSEDRQLECFLRTARKRWQLCSEAEQDQRNDFVDDLRFYSGEQWPSIIYERRKRQDRPCETFNQLPEIARQVLNEQRQMRPSIQVTSTGDSDLEVEAAEIFQGLIRHIEVASDAEIAYDTAFEHAVIGGFGYLRIVNQFASDDPRALMSGSGFGLFDQDLRIEWVPDPTSIYYDPACRTPDYSDGRFAFAVQDFPLEEYKAAFPDSEVAGLSDFDGIGNEEREWFTEQNIRVAEYFWRETKKQTFVQLVDGRVVTPEWLARRRGDPTVRVMARRGNALTREIDVPVIRWVKMNAREILEPAGATPAKPGTWPGRSIPIIPVLGEQLIVEGRRKLIGVVRHAKGAQRQYNFQRNALIETSALAPKTPWLAAEGQLEGYEDDYRLANVENIPVLYHKTRDLEGNPVQPPQRNRVEQPIGDLVVAVKMAKEDLFATTGIHQPNLGQRSRAESGKAINLLQKQGDVANFHLIDNLARSIRTVGRQLLDTAPEVYDRPGRVVRIVKPDQSQREVVLGQEFQGDDGIRRIYDISTGKYDVTVSVGPSYSSKRQEFVDSVLQLVQAYPQLMAYIGDLVVRHMDWPGAAEIADRLKKMLPAQLQEDEKQKNGQADIPPQFKAQFEALLQQHAALVEELKTATSVMEQKRLEIESRERIAAIQEETKRLVAMLKADSAEGIEMLRHEIGSLNKRLELLHSDRTVEQETTPEWAHPSAAANAAAPQPQPPTQVNAPPQVL